MRTWGHSKISCSCFCVWCESRELGSRECSRFHLVFPVAKISSDRVTLKILSNINDGAPLQKQLMRLRRWLFPQKSSTADLPRIQMRIRLEVLWSNQTTRNLTSGELGILLVVILLGVTGLKKIRSCTSYTLREGGEKGKCDVVCGASLGDWATARLCWYLIHV